VEGIHLGENRNLEEKIRPLLENESIFGVNLYDAGLADKVTGYLKEMLLAEGAVRRTLSRVIGE
jgi:fructuronate reductase